MNKREQVLAGLAGQPVDRVPVALWRHFPGDDSTAQGLANATLAFQAQFDFDLIKVTPASGYPVEDWGARFRYRGDREGTRECLNRPVNSLADWARLRHLDTTRGVLGRELEALRLIREGTRDGTPILETVFSPLYVAKSLAGDRYLSDLRRHPETLRAALLVIAETYARFSEAALAAGADGIFFATQCATYDLLTVEEYLDFGVPYDRLILDVILKQTELVILHVHGTNIMFDLLAQYPVPAINWHDRRTAPSLAQARQRFTGCLVGGVNEWETLQTDPAAIELQVKDAIAQAGRDGLIIGAGCVIPVDTPPSNILAVRRAVDSL